MVGSTSYANLAPQESQFLFAPIHTDDVAAAVGKALSSGSSGAYSLSGSEELTLRGVLDMIERSTGSAPGATKGKTITLDYFYDFFWGTASDLNMSRMVEHLENNQ